MQLNWCRQMDDTRAFARQVRRNRTDADNRPWLRLRSPRLLGQRSRRSRARLRGFRIHRTLARRRSHSRAAQCRSRACRSDGIRSDVLARTATKLLRFWDGDMLRDAEAVLTVIASRVYPGAGP